MSSVKQIIAEKLSEEFELTKDLAYKICIASLDAVYAATVMEGKARLGCHSFKVVSRGERMGRNPKTGEPIKIGASKRVSYKNTEAKKKK